MSGWDWPALAVSIGLAIFGATGLLMVIGAVIGSTRISRRGDPFADLDDDDFMDIAKVISERHGDDHAC